MTDTLPTSQSHETKPEAPAFESTDAFFVSTSLRRSQYDYEGIS